MKPRISSITIDFNNKNRNGRKRGEGIFCWALTGQVSKEIHLCISLDT
jgi:hypothetical protein